MIDIRCLKLFKRSDPQSLARAIQQVIEDEKLRNDLKRGAFTFQKRASWEKVADITLNTYLELIVEHPDSI